MKQLKPFKTSTIQVFIRVRKQLHQEESEEQIISVEDDNSTLIISEGTNQFSQKFDYAFNSMSQQVQVFEQIQKSLQEVPLGVNMTVFAYGQTGSGKTYTMFGNDWENQESQTSIQQRDQTKHQSTFYEDLQTDVNNAGIIPRTIYSLFNLMAQDFYIYCSFLQIYNEKIYDLLSGGNLSKALKLHESVADGIFVEGLTEYAVNHYYDCLSLMKRGEMNRVIRQTSMNTKSSRSHSIFQILLESNKPDLKGRIRRAKINLCDLAGSEKINKSESINAEHMTELKNINQSLTTLGKVIQNLSKRQKLPIPYRESKLTRLLQDSLGGNTQTILIANIAPGYDNIDETYSTLKFAERARNIIITVHANKLNSNDHILVSKLQREIDYLKSLLSMKRNNLNGNDIHYKMLKIQQENDRLRTKVQEVNQVDTLIQENRKMKLELQKMQGAVSMIQNDVDGQSTDHNEFLSSSYEKKIQSEQELKLKQTYQLRDQRQTSQRDARTNQFGIRKTTLMRNAMNMFNNPIPQTQVTVRVKSQHNQYSLRQGFIEENDTQAKHDRDLQKQKKRVMERLGDLDRMHQQNNQKMQDQLGLVNSKSLKQQNYDNHLKKIAEDLINN